MKNYSDNALQFDNVLAMHNTKLKTRRDEIQPTYKKYIVPVIDNVADSEVLY